MRKICLSLLFSIFSCALLAQVEYPGIPWSRERDFKQALEILRLPNVTPQARNEYLNQFSDRLKSSVFAYPINVSLADSRDGVWEEFNDGSRIWRLAVESQGARSINLIFRKFHIPAGAALYLYSQDYKVVRGAFTRDNETRSGVFPTMPVPGDRIIIELDLPAFPDFKPAIEIMQVSHDFKGFFGSEEMDHSGSCNVDINCPAGADWQIEKRSVVKFIRGGTLLCSGALINNTAIDGRPLLFTANHCIGVEWHAQQSVFYFRYEKPDCVSGTGSLQFSLSGSRLLATTSKLDFSLVELNTAPPKNYEPYYAGWDRRVVIYLDSVTCIHHPAGDVKKISKSYHRVVTGDFGGGYDSNTHWLISQWDLGTTEGGSSGSPLFNSDHRIVGDLTGGDASCDYNFNDYFQKISISWDKYPDSSDQLKCWLDPGQTGAQVMNGYDPYSGGKPLANFEARPEIIHPGKNVYLADHSTGSPVSWTWTIPGADQELLSGQDPGPVVFAQTGLYTITLKVQNSEGVDSIRQTVKVFDCPGGWISENRVVRGRAITLTDASRGEPLSVTWNVTGAEPSMASGLEPVVLSFTNAGEFTVKQEVEFIDNTYTLIHYNRIKVLPDVIIYKPVSFSNVSSVDHTGYLTLGSRGYCPGSNSEGITAYAEEFRNTGDTARMITGLTIALEKISLWDSVYYLPLVVWDSARKEMHRDSILLNDKEPGTRITCWFKSPVSFKKDQVTYAGFEIKPWENGTFCSAMAVDRGKDGASTVFAVRNNQWLSITDLAGIHSSIDLSLETAYLPDTYEQEIRILPNSNEGSFSLNLGHLVYNKAGVSVFNLKGQKVMSDLTRSGNLIELQIHPPASGIYLVSLKIDDYRFTQKVVVIRH